MGSVVLSVDAELGWGFHDQDDPPPERLRAARRGWHSILDLFDRYEVPATWAVVGHLFLDQCDGLHSEHPAPDGWFDRERGHDAFPRRLRMGGDLVPALLDADVVHDVGAHTFSHVEFGDPVTTHPIARAEVVANLDAADRWGVYPKSFVFPRNNVGHRDVLAAYGFTCYRGRNPTADADAGPLGPLRKLARATVGAPPLITPEIDEYGLVNVPASLFLFGFEGWARTLAERISGDPIVSQARAGIDRAAEADGVFHMWLHPNNLVSDRDVERLRSILDYLSQRRGESAVRVETMYDVAERTLPDLEVPPTELRQ